MFAFGGVLLKKLPQEQIALDVGAYKQVSSFVAEFLMNNTGEWIRQNGGWVCVITHTHIYTHTYMYIYAHICVYMYTHIYLMYTYIYIHECVYIFL